MNSSPYFSRARGRRVQSAAKAAAATLGSKRRTRKHVKVEYESDAKAARVEKKESERNTAKRSATGKDNSTRQTDEAVQWEPARWREQLVNIREMRKNRDAPVDSQGCEKAADSNEAPEVSDVSCLQTLQL